LEYFLQHKQVILRTLGAVLLLIGFVIHFWAMPQKGVSTNELATANLARMEASVAGKSAPKAGKKRADGSQFLKKLKDQQEQQMQYLTILFMLLGLASLGYSFLKKENL